MTELDETLRAVGLDPGLDRAAADDTSGERAAMQAKSSPRPPSELEAVRDAVAALRDAIADLRDSTAALRADLAALSADVRVAIEAKGPLAP
jgi:hypothetical protein